MRVIERRSNQEKRFKDETSQTIHNAIHQEKLDRARNLLTATSLSINEISQICGHPSLQYFYSVFKKGYEYRDRFGEAGY